MAHLIRLMGVSERFACRVTGQNRTTQRRPPAARRQRPGCRAAGLAARLGESHPRRGFRNAYHDARGEGWVVNHKKIQRLWREEGLRVPQRRRRKRLGTSTARAAVRDAPNKVWAVDFQFDSTTDGRPVKIVSIVDEHTRECLGGLVERSITADVLIDELDRLAPDAATRRCCAVTTGPSWPAPRWPTGPAIASPGVHPARPALAQRLYRIVQRPVRDECLNINIFWSLAHARVVIADWKEEYNHHRRHSALGYQAPARYAADCTHQ